MSLIKHLITANSAEAHEIELVSTAHGIQVMCSQLAECLFADSYYLVKLPSHYNVINAHIHTYANTHLEAEREREQEASAVAGHALNSNQGQ